MKMPGHLAFVYNRAGTAHQLRLLSPALTVGLVFLGHTVWGQEAPLLNFTFDDANGDVTDTVLNPLVTAADEWTSIAVYGDGFFIPITAIPVNFSDGRVENNLNFASFNVEWGVAGQFTISEAVSVSQVSFTYGVNGMNKDGFLTFSMGTEVVAVEPIGDTEFANNNRTGSFVYTFARDEFILAAGDVDLSFSLIGDDGLGFDVNFDSATDGTGGIDGYFWIDDFQILFFQDETFEPPVELYPGTIVSITDFPTFRERLGTVYPLVVQEETAATAYCKDGKHYVACPTTPEQENYFLKQSELGDPSRDQPFWFRIDQSNMTFGSPDAGEVVEHDKSRLALQAGYNVFEERAGDGTLTWIDITAQVTQASTSVGQASGGGGIDALGFGVGVTATRAYASGFYLDGQAQVNTVSSDITAPDGSDVVTENDGLSYGLSLELGKVIALNNGLMLTPQMQLTTARGTADDFTASDDTFVSEIEGVETTLRFGASLDREVIRPTGVSRFWGFGNLLQDLDSSSSALADGDAVTHDRSDTLAELGVGFDISMRDDAARLYGQAALVAGVDDPDTTFGYNASLGMRLSW